MRNWLLFMRSVIGFFHSTLILALLVSASATRISPADFWPVSLAGLVFLPLYIFNLMILPVWIVRKKRFVVFPILAALITAPLIPRSIQLRMNKDPDGDLRLMTWNVKLFDLYGWSGQSDTRAKMMSFIRKENPDILCLQEFYNHSEKQQNVQYIRDSLHYPYVFFKPRFRRVRQINGERITSEVGVVLFSKYPIIGGGSFPLSTTPKNYCSFADIKIKDKAIRVFTTHLQSIHLDDMDYAHLEELEQHQSIALMHAGTILRKLKRAWKSRHEEVQKIRSALDAYPGPHIICGDFNEVPVSYTYQQLSKGLQDAFIHGGSGLGATLFGKFFLFRIDYAFFSSEFRIRSSRIIPKKWSDHYPIVVSFDGP